MPREGEELDLETAKQRLRDFGGFDWLLSGRSHWKAAEIEEELRKMGWDASRDTLIRWLSASAPALALGNLGTMFKTEDVIRWAASQIRDPRDKK